MSANAHVLHLWTMEPGEKWWHVACGRRLASVRAHTSDPLEMTCQLCAAAVAAGKAVPR